MVKNYVLLNVDNNKYWTGRYWEIPYSTDIKDAKLFSTEEELIEELVITEEENYSARELLDEVQMFEVRTVFIKKT